MMSAIGVGSRLPRVAGAAILCAQALAGCAHAYIDAAGSRNVIGWVHLTLPASTPEPKAADGMRMRTVGLALSRTDIGGALEFGYSDNTLAVIRNHSCVQIDRLPTAFLTSPGAHHASVSTDHPFPPIASAACLVLLATGCAQAPTNVVFMTKASIGVDVEATAQTASFAYDRVEGYFPPRYPHQAPAPVFASLDTNGQTIDRKNRGGRHHADREADGLTGFAEGRKKKGSHDHSRLPFHILAPRPGLEPGTCGLTASF